MSQVSTCFSFTLDGWAIFSSEPASFDQKQALLEQ